jgi:hypothetical protein
MRIKFECGEGPCFTPGSRLPIPVRIVVPANYFKTCRDMKKLDELLPAA